MKKATVLIVLVILLASLVSAQSFFEGSIWDDWFTGKVSFSDFFARRAEPTPAATAPKNVPKVQPVIFPKYRVYLPDVQLSEKTDGVVTLGEYNAVVDLYAALLGHAQKNYERVLMTFISAQTNAQGDMRIYFLLDNGDQGVVVRRADASIATAENILMDKNGNIKAEGNLDALLIQAVLFGYDVKNIGLAYSTEKVLPAGVRGKKKSQDDILKDLEKKLCKARKEYC